MFDFIPVDYFYHIHYNLLLCIVLFTLIHNYVLNIDDKENIKYLRSTGTVLFVFLLLFYGLRPVHGSFIDMVTYAAKFDRYQSGLEVITTHDVTFEYFMKFCSSFMNKTMFFFICASLYITPLFIISIKFFKEYWFYSFLILVGSFSFLAYGVNGIRNGIATSLFLLALAYKDNRRLLVLFITLSVLFHKTMFLPGLAFLATVFYNKPKAYLIFWFISIPLSLAFGNSFSIAVSGLGLSDQRFEGYLISEAGRFRWDFLIYSSSAVFAGYYFIFKKGFKDEVYAQLFNIYLMCNTFWILVIRANFSNRFAYLSWFMMGLVIIYPYLKQRFFKDQSMAVGKVLLAYFAFAYFMFLKEKFLS